MAQLTVSTIIISYNTAELTCQAIQSVIDNYQQDNIHGEILVVDNNSSDGSVKKIKKRFAKHIQLIENSENVGFAKANNQAIKGAKGEYYFLLNSDTKLHPHAIRQLLAVFQRYPDDLGTAELKNSQNSIDHVGMVSGQLLNPDGSIQPQGGALPTLLNLKMWWLWPLPGTIPFVSQYHIEDTTFFTTERKIGWLGGTALMLRQAFVKEVGLLDEDIFMYAEDVDWAIRANDHHWDCVISPDAKITHYGSASSSAEESLAREVTGLLYVAAKHWSVWKVQLLKKIFQIGAALRWLLFGIILGNEKKKKLYQRIFKSAQ